MPEKDLEFRGIMLKHHDTYIRELGAKPVLSSAFPYIYEGNGWSAHICGEREISFTAAFKVNVVYMRFIANSEELLRSIVKQYRIKTFRAGG